MTGSDLTTLGLPADAVGCLFDVDGVLTRTADVHASAWKQMFDEYLRQRAERTGTRFVPFDAGADYARYVDGKPRADGTQSFLRSRDIDLLRGNPDDPPDADSVSGLGNRKNELLQQIIARDGVRPFEGSLRYLRAVRNAGLRTATVSSSANAKPALHSAGFDGLFDAAVDGVTAAERHLAGKPDPAMFLAAAELLGVTPQRAVVFEDALVGVQAGRAGGFGRTIGVNRLDQADALRSHGADVVVDDLVDLLGER